MKRPFPLFLLMGLFLFSCSNKEEITTFEDAVATTLKIEVLLTEGHCCSNLTILDGASVFSPLEERADELLAGVNMVPFIEDLNLELGDHLLITYGFTTQAFNECVSICNRHSGLRIEVASVKKL